MYAATEAADSPFYIKHGQSTCTHIALKFHIERRLAFRNKGQLTSKFQ